MVEPSGCQYRDRSSLFPGTGGDRRFDHSQLRLRQQQCRHSGGRRADPAHQLADCVLRIHLRGRHRSAYARRRLWLSRIDDHFPNLRLVHFPVLRHRGGDHVARVRNVFRHPAFPGLRAELLDRYSAGDARYYFHQPLSVLDAAGVDRAASHSFLLHRGGRQRIVRALDEFLRICRRRGTLVQSHPVRDRRNRRVLAHRANRRAGRFPAVSAGARCAGQACLVGRLSGGGSGLDHSRRVEVARRIVPGVPRC